MQVSNWIGIPHNQNENETNKYLISSKLTIDHCSYFAILTVGSNERKAYIIFHHLPSKW